MSPYSLLAHLLQRRIPLHARAFLFGGKSSKQNCRRVTASQCAWASCSACHPCKVACCKVSFSDCLVASSGKNWEENKQLKKKKSGPCGISPASSQDGGEGGRYVGWEHLALSAAAPGSALRVGLTLGYHDVLGFCCGQHFVTAELKERGVFMV